MADITMCSNDTCPSKLHCYRWTATPNEYRQSVAMFEWMLPLGTGTMCNDYYPDMRKTKLTKE